LNCIGSGSPTVLLEADLDQLGSLSWAMVQPELGELTRVCSYDRAGILWSQAGPRPRDGKTVAAELMDLLQAAGEEGPYLLVGHAMGGAYARIFAGNHPESVCGLVLLDSSHPDQIQRFSEIGIRQEIPQQKLRPFIFLLSYLGAPGRYKGLQYTMPLEVYKTEQAYLPESSMAWFDEAAEGPNTLAQAGEIRSLGDLPLVVLASARPAPISGTPDQEPQKLWLDLQEDLTSISTRSELRSLEDAGHYIQFDQPGEVTQAVKDLFPHCLEVQPHP
jgi:pimeloyl-ACP methyl ester carboxylesterase